MFFPHLMQIGYRDRVLEIGPGAYPFWRSDCCADVFDETSIVDNTQFGGKGLDTKGKPLFKIEGGKLPFKDKSFDYVICSHVFEHVPSSELPLLISEIMRVSRKAYIEFPRPLYDYLYNFDVHLNLMDIVNGHIYCLDKRLTGLSKVGDFQRYAMHHRRATDFSVDRHFASHIAVGKEFTESIGLTIVNSEQEFWAAVTENAYMLRRPGLVWMILNRLHPVRLWRQLFGEPRREEFIALLKTNSN